MKRHLLFSLFTLALLLLGGVNVSVKATVTAPDDPKATPLSISGKGFDTKYANWDELKKALIQHLKFGDGGLGKWFINVDVWDDIDDSFGDWQLFFDNDDYKYNKVVVLRLNGHKIKGNNILVNQSGLEFIIQDKEYTPVTYNSKYEVNNNNTGLISVTGSISATAGARVIMESGCVEATGKYIAFGANGDKTQKSSIASQVIIKGGYVTAPEGCAGAFGKGANLIVNGTWVDENQHSTGTDGNPILLATDNAAVSGNGLHEGVEGNYTKNYAGTTITLGKCVLIGNIKSPGYAACGVYHPQEGTLNIGDGAQIIAYSDKVAAAGVVMRGGTLNMTGGSIIANGVADAKGKVGDSRVVVPSSGIVFDADANYYDRANVKVEVSDGTVNGNHSAVELVNNNKSYTDGQITLTGGTYNSDVAQFAGEGLGILNNSKTYTFAEGRAAETTDANGVVRYYNKFYQALSLFGTGRTTKMLTDVDLRVEMDGDNYCTFYVTAEGVTTLDLNGHKLTTSAEISYGAIAVKDNAHLVINDSKGSGVVDCPNNTRGLIFLTSNASLTIYGGTFKAYDPLFYNSYSGNYTIKVLGGNFDAQRLCTSANKSGNYYLRGGCYSPTLYRSISSYTDKIDNGYLFKEESGDYPWRIVSGVNTTYGEETTAVEKNDNDRFVIALKDLTKLEVAQDFKNVNVTVQKDFTTADEWNAFYAPFDLAVTDELLEKFEIAKIWDTELKWDGETPKTTIEFIKLKSGAEIPAFTPCLILAKEAGVQDITADNVTLGNTTDTRDAIDCSTVDQLFTFTGVLESTPIYHKYGLKGNELRYATNEKAMLSPFKFYMTITDRKTKQEVSEPKPVSIRVIGDETNGINDLNDEATRIANDKVYTLQGSLVGTSLQGLPAGIYVQNGRKYVVK